VSKLDYIIVTHNELPYLKLMWDSIKNHNTEVLSRCDVKIFDSSNNDDTKNWCKQQEIEYERTTLPGLYSTWNYAVSITENPLIILSTSDHVLAPNFWKNILEQQEKHLDIHFFTGTCLDNGISYPHEDNVAIWGWPYNGYQLPTERRWFKRDCGDTPENFSYEKFLLYKQEIDTGLQKEITLMETSYCPLLVTRENFKALGGFDLSLEYPKPADTDFLHRMMIAGRQFAIVDSAFEYHFSSKGRYLRNFI